MAIGLPFAVGAQTAPGPGPAHPGGPPGPGAAMPMHPPPAGDGAQTGMMMGEARMPRHLEGMIAFYKAELGITAAQDPQWSAFANVVRSRAKRMSDNDGANLPERTMATAPERLDARVARLSAEFEIAKALAATGTALYTVLTEDQRRMADRFISQPLRGMMQ